MTTTSRTTLLRNKTFLNLRRRIRMEINPQTWIFNYPVLRKNISFGGVFLKLATVQYWRQSASLDEQRQFIRHCQNSHAPVRSLHLEIILKFLSKLLEQQKGNAAAKQLQIPFNPERQNKKPKFFLINCWAIQCDHLSAMKATGVAGLRSRTHTRGVSPLSSDDAYGITGLHRQPSGHYLEIATLLAAMVHEEWTAQPSGPRE